MWLHRNHTIILHIINIFCAAVLANDLFEGYEFGVRMSYIEVKKPGLPFFKRQESVVLKYPTGTKISGIACVDLSPSKQGTAIVVRGGIDSSFVQIDLESDRSTGLKYIIEIYSTYVKLKPEDITGKV